MTDSVTVRGGAGWPGDFDGAGDPFIEGAKATVAMFYHFQDTAQFCTERLHWGGRLSCEALLAPDAGILPGGQMELSVAT